MKFSRFQSIVLNSVLSLTIQNYRPVVATQNSCGSLLNYRHYLTQLEAAPKCFTNSCSNQTSPLSILDKCSTTRPCSSIWNLIHDQFQQDWCSSCNKDVACRIRGWPVFNASAFGNAYFQEPSFASDVSCCADGNQATKLSEWTHSLGDEAWRKPFEDYAGFAKLDWDEWILPWNWTFRVENATMITSIESCSKRYLLLAFSVENIVIFLFVLLLRQTVAIQYLRAREAQRSMAMRLHRWGHALIYLKFWKWFRWIILRRDPMTEHDESDNFQSLIKSIIISSTLMTALQIGFNFLNAWRIQSTEGYQHVPIIQLSLLFCCRPRVTWVACIFCFISPEKF